jgi:lipopolysaccharide transport system permease protein
VTAVATTYFASTTDLVRTVVAQRRLLWALAKRELSDEYVSHGLSVVWNVIQPIFTMLVYLFTFTLVWPTRVQAPEGLDVDAVVLLLSGIIPWMAMTQVMSRSMTSVVNNSNIVKQMAFPLELLPLKTLASPLGFFVVSLAFLIVYSGWMSGGKTLIVYLWGVPLLIAISLVLFAGLALLLSSVQVFFRDTKEFVSMFLSIGLFLHPVLYLPNAVPQVVRGVLYMSPFSYFLFCWRDILFYGSVTQPWAWVVTIVFSTAVFLLGSRLFLGSRPHFGDFL